MRAVENRSDYIYEVFFSRVTTFQALPLFRAAFKPRENRGIQPAGAKRSALAVSSKFLTYLMVRVILD